MRGKILTHYGESGGQKSDGIDIAADNGAPVKAADGGTVVYSGDGVPQLGNLLLIEHSSGYITAYGYNESPWVKKGDKVTKGETIARAGSSGGAASPRLHFEVRRGGDHRSDDAAARLGRSFRPSCTDPGGPRSRGPRRRGHFTCCSIYRPRPR